MSFGVHFFKYNDDGEMLFYVMGANRKTAEKGQMILGTKPNEEGFTEDRLREFLEHDIGLDISEIDGFIKNAKESAESATPPDSDQIAS